MIPARYIVAAALIVFVWRDATVKVQWPLPNVSAPAIATPPAEQLAWAEPLRGVLPKMLPQDRRYLADFYEAMQFILMQDGKRQQQILSDTDKFVVFHAGSLQAAIEKENVGKYTGLDKAIDQVFFASSGADTMTLDAKARQKLIDACGVLSYVFRVNGE